MSYPYSVSNVDSLVTFARLQASDLKYVIDHVHHHKSLVRDPDDKHVLAKSLHRATSQAAMSHLKLKFSHRKILSKVEPNAAVFDHHACRDLSKDILSLGHLLLEAWDLLKELNFDYVGASIET